MDGYQEALRRIEKNKRTKDTFLDLGNLGLTEIPEEVFDCVWLEDLNLGGIYHDRRIEKLTFADRGAKNQIINLPSGLLNLANLKGLGIESNQISQIETLSYLRELTHLYLSRNRISILNALSSLTNLEYLYLTTNLIKDTIESLSSLNHLTHLFLGGNKIVHVESLSSLKQLVHLDLCRNLISNISPLASLEKLNYLNLSDNEIDQIPVAFLKHRMAIGLENNNSSFGMILAKNPLAHPPMEIVKKGKVAMKAYFEQFSVELGSKKKRLEELEKKLKELKDSNIELEKILHEFESNNISLTNNFQFDKLNQVKTILIGDGGAGKTSLLKQFFGEAFDKKESQTHGINIRQKDFEIKEETIGVNFWDFGGQEIMHATHQFFLSRRAVYLLVLDSRKEDKAEYWLKHIASFGGKSPVIVLINKIDENPAFDVNRKFLKEKYPNICCFLRISCQSGEGIAELRSIFEKEIYDLELRQTLFSKAWFEVKEALDSMEKDFITGDDYLALCKEKGIESTDQRKTLLQFLHDLGIVLWFDKLKYYNTQVLNPRWLTNGVYRIINSKSIAKKEGYLRLNQLDDILNKKQYEEDELRYQYPESKFLFIMKIMQEFELCYELEEEKYMIPDLLAIQECDTSDFDYDGALTFEMHYDFLPPAVMPRFMVQLHERIQPNQQWRTGVVLEDAIFKTKAVIKLDKEDRKIKIWVNGKLDRRRDFFAFIRKALNDINDTFDKLGVKEYVPLARYDHPEILIDYEELVGYEQMGIADYPVGKLRQKFPVEDLLNGIERPQQRRDKKLAPVKVFVSYAHKDNQTIKYKDELITSLAYLQRMEQIEVWEDGEIIAGQEWEKEIYEQLEAAQIVVCLVSNSFIASDFCWTIELKQALEAHNKGEKVVIPIQIEQSGWAKTDLGKIQGLPTQPVSSYNPRADGWAEIFEHFEQVVEAIQQKQRATIF